MKALATQSERTSTLAGIAAILFWSTSIAFSRSLTEQLGTLTAAAVIYLSAGILGFLHTASQPGRMAKMRKLPLSYLAGCGSLFVIYMVALYLAIGTAASRTQVLAVGLINYLWPGLSLVFSIPILGKRGTPLLPIGIAVALAGVWLASTGADGALLPALIQEQGALAPYGLALAAAVSWGLHSNLSRYWGGSNDGGGVPLFLLASGLALGVLRMFTIEAAPAWTLKTGFELAYMALFPGVLGYALWDHAVRKGEITFLSAASYITPLLSTLVSAVVLDVTPGKGIWLGAAMVFAGAILCKKGIAG